jgi:catechol 2,3-dioxygenase-like lactoylglutathione lyase family enzyme
MISRVLEACLYATNLDAAERFYVDVLGLERYSAMPGRHVFFRCGAGMFLVFNPVRDPAGNCVELASPKLWGFEDSEDA